MDQEYTPPSIASLKDFEFIGEGNDFLTWRAFSTELNKKVEVISAKPGANPVKAAHVAYTSSLFLKMNHPSLAEVYEVGKDGASPFVIQEVPQGKSLAAIVKTNGPLTDKDVLSCALQISEALAYATSQANIVLRNIKPQNIYIDENGVAKITDFRYSIIARDPQHGPSIDGDNIIGTPSFISPEQAEASPYVDFRADMYALGTVLYFLLLHRTPFDGMDSLDILESQRSAQIANPRELNPHISTEITALITRLLVKNPDMRYQSWSSVVSEINNIIAGKKCSRLQAGAVSTIAPLPGETQFTDTVPELFDDKKDAKNHTTEQAQQPPPVNPFAEQKKTTGGGWKFLLWLVLMIWFVFLVNCRMKNPMHLPEVLAPEISIPALDTLTDAIAGKNKTSETSTELQGLPDHPTAANTSTAQVSMETPPQSVSAASEESSSSAKPVPAPEREINQEEMSLILAKLREGDIRGADAAARAFANTPKGREIYDFLVKTGDIDKTLGDIIMDRHGKSIAIKFKGKDRNVVPDKLVNDELTVIGTRNDGETFNLVLKLSQFSESEKLHLISNYATTEYHHIVAAALALKLGDTDCFKRHSGNTGPLVPVFSLVQ